jgi:hypothetical protein
MHIVHITYYYYYYYYTKQTTIELILLFLNIYILHFSILSNNFDLC